MTGLKLVEAIAAERSRQTDKYDPLLVALGRAMAPHPLDAPDREG